MEICMHLRGEGKDVRCALDDRKARKIANLLDIEVKGTIGLLEELRRREYLTKEVLNSLCCELKGNNFRFKMDMCLEP